MKVEFFFAEGCKRCAAARDALRVAASRLEGVDWQDVNIGFRPERAVEAGVVSTPAIAIDGVLVFKTAPTPEDLVAALHARA